jgi:acyl dehydratase
MNQLSGRYLEDFAVGQTFGSGRLRVDKERIFAFAAEFDPQPFHLDEAAARHSIFGGLSASGHTAAVTMRPIERVFQAYVDRLQRNRRTVAAKSVCTFAITRELSEP